MLSLVYGTHTEQAYSSDGRTRDFYVCSFFDCGGTDVNISTEEPKCIVCLYCNIVILFKDRLYCDTHIFGFIDMLLSM